MKRRHRALPPRPDWPGSSPARAPHDRTGWAVVAVFVMAAFAAVAIGVAAPTGSFLEGPVGTGASPTTDAPAPDSVPTDPNGDFAFLAVTYVDGKRVPVRWDPCEPIAYQLDLRAGPPNARAAIEAAIEGASDGSGYAFVDDGRAHEHIQRLLDDRFFADALHSVYRPVLITVISHQAFRRFDLKPGVLAFAHPQQGAGAFDDQYVAGAVVIDGGRGYARHGRWSLGLVAQHELGHLLGLAHVGATDELMFSFEVAKRSIPEPIDGWGPGDMDGLRRLGGDPTCLERVHVRP